MQNYASQPAPHKRIEVYANEILTLCPIHYSAD